jgi:hypothetical protein
VLGPPGPPGGWGVASLAVASAFAVTGAALCRRLEQAAFAAAVAVAAVDVALLVLRGTRTA